MKETKVRRIVVVMAATILLLPMVALAESFEVTLNMEILYGTAGEEFDLGTFPVPDGLVGQSCSVTATGNNNQSMHPGNDVLVTSGTVVVLEGVEDSENKTTVATGTLELAATVSFMLRLGDDLVYSAELEVLFECEPAVTTTSTTPDSTTTTSPASTTTIPATTTTTSVPEGTTSTSEGTAATSTTSTTVSESTSSTETAETLPYTGVVANATAGVAVLAVAVGFGLVLATRWAEES